MDYLFSIVPVIAMIYLLIKIKQGSNESAALRKQVIDLANRPPKTFGKAAFIGLVDQVRQDFVGTENQKLVVKYVKLTTELSGAKFTAVDEISAEIESNATEIAANDEQIERYEQEITELRHENREMVDQNTVLHTYISVA